MVTFYFIVAFIFFLVFTREKGYVIMKLLAALFWPLTLLIGLLR